MAMKYCVQPQSRQENAPHAKSASCAVDRKERRVLQNQLLFQCMAQERSTFLQITIKGAKCHIYIK